MPLIADSDIEAAPPECFPVIRYDDSLAQQVRFALIGGYNPIEACQSIRPTGTIGGVEVTAGGLAYVAPSSVKTTWPANIPSLDPYLSGSFTVMWYGVLRANALGHLLVYLGGYGWRLSTNSWAPGALLLELGAEWRGGGPQAVVAVTDNTLHSVIARYNEPTATTDIFLDGVRVLSGGAFTKDPGAVSSGSFYMVDLSAGGTPHKMLTTQAFAGNLNAKQVAILVDNPYHVFDDNERSLWVPGGGVTAPAFQAAWARNSNAILTGTIQ